MKKGSDPKKLGSREGGHPRARHRGGLARLGVGLSTDPDTVRYVRAPRCVDAKSVGLLYFLREPKKKAREQVPRVPLVLGRSPLFYSCLRFLESDARGFCGDRSASGASATAGSGTPARPAAT